MEKIDSWHELRIHDTECFADTDIDDVYDGTTGAYWNIKENT